MKNVIELRGAVCVAALLTASTAIADVTAAEVWADWQDSLMLYGSEGISIGAEEVDGDTLTIRDLNLTMEDDSSSVTANIGPLVFTENGDGTVSITMPDSYIIAVNVEDDFIVDLEIAQENMVVLVSGDPDAMNYDISADSSTIRLVEFKGDAADIEGDIFLKANAVSGTYQSNSGAADTLIYSLLAESIDILFDVQEPGGDSYVLVSGKVDRLNIDGKINAPEGLDTDNPETWFADGFDFDSSFEYLGASFLADFNDNGDAGTVTVQMGYSGFGASMDAAELSYGFAFEGVDVNAQMSDLPFPVNVSWNVAEMGFHAPIASTEDPVEFGFDMALTDVTVSDDIWSMVDPSGAIPRDPISIELDISGLAKLFFDVLDPEQAEAMAYADVPGELNTLQLIGLRLAGAGAEIVGDGDFTFDNTDLETFDGLPRPQGELNIGITGANALIDTAVNMGLLPAEQATMGRMFMGMFTVPAGDDTLTSKIEINEQGHIMANGQRIQ
jgi:hypothetical protein